MQIVTYLGGLVPAPLGSEKYFVLIFNVKKIMLKSVVLKMYT